MGKKAVVHMRSGIFVSVQFSHSVVSDSLQPHESQHARPPCPSPTPGVYSNPTRSFRSGYRLFQGHPLKLSNLGKSGLLQVHFLHKVCVVKCY